MTGISLYAFITLTKVFLKVRGREPGEAPSIHDSVCQWPAENGTEFMTSLLWVSAPSPVNWHFSSKVLYTRIYNSKILWVHQIPMWLILVIRSFIEVNLFLLKQTKLNYRFLHCTQQQATGGVFPGDYFGKFVIFQCLTSNQCPGITF